MKHAVLVLLALIISTRIVSAEEIYKWIDEAGITHYSTSKSDQKARLAELPKFNKGEYKVSSTQSFTCDQHGGINCQAGEDADGSVICFDGFTEAAARFKFHCSSPKLTLSDISVPDEKGRFSIFVRNDRSVTARLPKVIFINIDGSKVPMKGPTEIKEFQMAEFTVISGFVARTHGKPKESQFSISCENCDQ